MKYVLIKFLVTICDKKKCFIVILSDTNRATLNMKIKKKVRSISSLF